MSADLIVADYLQHTDRDPWGDDRVLVSGDGDVYADGPVTDADRTAWLDADDDYRDES